LFIDKKSDVWPKEVVDINLAALQEAAQNGFSMVNNIHLNFKMVYGLSCQLRMNVNEDGETHLFVCLET
jgi:hypothetical protein